MDFSKLNSLKPSRIQAQELLADRGTASAQTLATLAQLYRAYVRGWVSRKISPRFRRRFQSSSVVQETLVRIQIQASASMIRGRSIAEFEHYLLKTARAVIVDLTRRHVAKRRSVYQEISLDELESRVFWGTMRSRSEPAPDEFIAERDEKQQRISAVRRALDALPSHYRKVIREHYENGRSADEIAQLIDRSPGATRALIARAVKTLQETMQNYGPKNLERERQ